MINIWTIVQKLPSMELETEKKAGDEEIWGRGTRDTTTEIAVFALTLLMPSCQAEMSM